jgi:hypothetical protein
VDRRLGVALRVGLDTWEKRKLFSLCWELNTKSSFQPIA